MICDVSRIYSILTNRNSEDSGRRSDHFVPPTSMTRDVIAGAPVIQILQNWLKRQDLSRQPIKTIAGKRILMFWKTAFFLQKNVYSVVLSPSLHFLPIDLHSPFCNSLMWQRKLLSFISSPLYYGHTLRRDDTISPKWSQTGSRENGEELSFGGVKSKEHYAAGV